jgi:hypothetical protein
MPPSSPHQPSTDHISVRFTHYPDSVWPRAGLYTLTGDNHPGGEYFCLQCLGATHPPQRRFLARQRGTDRSICGDAWRGRLYRPKHNRIGGWAVDRSLSFGGRPVAMHCWACNSGCLGPCIESGGLERAFVSFFLCFWRIWAGAYGNF